jgi:hypothetical protein
MAGGSSLADDEVGMDVLEPTSLSFPRSLPEFQTLFPDDAACATYLQKMRCTTGSFVPIAKWLKTPSALPTGPEFYAAASAVATLP